jgi:hypothetical protein
LNSRAAGDRITKDERIARSLGAVPSKLNSAVPTKITTCVIIVLQETLVERAAQPTLKNVGLVVLIQPLAINGRVNPELRASSVVDLMCIRRCDRARRDPTTCTP